MGALSLLGKFGLGTAKMVGRGTVGAAKIYGRAALYGAGIARKSHPSRDRLKNSGSKDSSSSDDPIADIQSAVQRIDTNISQNSSLLSAIATSQKEAVSKNSALSTTLLGVTAAVGAAGALIYKYFGSEDSTKPSDTRKTVDSYDREKPEPSSSEAKEPQRSDLRPQRSDLRPLPSSASSGDMHPVSYGSGGGRSLKIKADTITFKGDKIVFDIGSGRGFSSGGGGGSSSGFQRVAYNDGYFPKMGAQASGSSLGGGGSFASSSGLGSVPSVSSSSGYDTGGSVGGGGGSIGSGAYKVASLGPSGSGGSSVSDGSGGGSGGGDGTATSHKGFDAEGMKKGGVNPLLVESMTEGAKKAFGDPNDPKTRYVLSTGGGGGAGIGTRGDGSKHDQGKAVDLQIFDRQTGKFVGQDKTGSQDIMKNAFGNRDTYAIYDALHRSRYDYVKEKYGENAASRMSSGTRFWAKKQGGIDQMHASMDEGGKIGPLSKAPNLDHKLPNGKTLGEWLGKDNIPTEDYATKYKQTIDGSAVATSKPDVSSLNKDVSLKGNDGPGTLKDQRKAFIAEMENNPALKDRVMALASAENGTGKENSTSRQATIETMMNRAAAQGKTLAEVVDKSSGYWGPDKNGGRAYNEHLGNLQNPEYRKMMESELSGAGIGSNHSKFATHEGSAGVAANARQTQTVTTTMPSGQQFSRKDRPEYSNLHGAGTVKAEASWYERTQQAEIVAALKSKQTADISGQMPKPVDQAPLSDDLKPPSAPAAQASPDAAPPPQTATPPAVEEKAAPPPPVDAPSNPTVTDDTK